LHKLLWELRRDASLAARFRADPGAVLRAYDLEPRDRNAIAARDFRTLYDRGANPYLLYFCALQIGVSREDYYAQLRAGQPAGTAGTPASAENVQGGSPQWQS
jgi:hypothetical protein